MWVCDVLGLGIVCVLMDMLERRGHWVMGMLEATGGGDLVSCRYSFCPLMWISRVFGRNLEGDRLPVSEIG